MNSFNATLPATSEPLHLKASAAPLQACRGRMGLHLFTQGLRPQTLSLVPSLLPPHESVYSSVATVTLHMYTPVLSVSLLTTHEWLSILASIFPASIPDST